MPGEKEIVGYRVRGFSQATKAFYAYADDAADGGWDPGSSDDPRTRPVDRDAAVRLLRLCRAWERSVRGVGNRWTYQLVRVARKAKS